MFGTQLIIHATDMVIGLFTVMIFFVIYIICSTENDVVVNVSFVDVSGNDVRIFPL